MNERRVLARMSVERRRRARQDLELVDVAGGPSRSARGRSGNGPDGGETSIKADGRPARKGAHRPRVQVPNASYWRAVKPAMNTQEAAESDELDRRTCRTCGERLQLRSEIGSGLPLGLVICGCGIVIQYDPHLGSHGPCPLCEAVDELEDLDFGEHFTHTHVQNMPVLEDGKTEPRADVGSRPPA